MTYANPFHFSVDALSQFEFSDHDVVNCMFEQRRRRSDLYKAVSFGSAIADRVILRIEGKTMCTLVHTRAVAIGMTSLFIEQSVVIPIRSISGVVFDQARYN